MEARSVHEIIQLAEAPARTAQDAAIDRSALVLYIFRVPNTGSIVCPISNAYPTFTDTPSADVCATLVKPFGKSISAVDIDNALYHYNVNTATPSETIRKNEISASSIPVSTLLRRDPYGGYHQPVAKVARGSARGSDISLQILNSAYTQFGRSPSWTAGVDQDIFTRSIQMSSQKGPGGQYFPSLWAGDDCVFQKSDGHFQLCNRSATSSILLSEFRISLPIKIGASVRQDNTSYDGIPSNRRSSMFIGRFKQHRQSECFAQSNHFDVISQPVTAIDQNDNPWTLQQGHPPAQQAGDQASLFTIPRKAVGSSGSRRSSAGLVIRPLDERHSDYAMPSPSPTESPELPPRRSILDNVAEESFEQYQRDMSAAQIQHKRSWYKRVSQNLTTRVPDEAVALARAQFSRMRQPNNSPTLSPERGVGSPPITLRRRLSSSDRNSTAAGSPDANVSVANKFDRPKLGKLVLYGGGQCMMDLAVAANLAMFQRALDEAERRAWV